MAALSFEVAKRTVTQAKIMLYGPPGAGKTLTALKLMRGLVGDTGKVIMIETERQGEGIPRSSTYERLGHFVGLLEPPFRPQKFIDAIKGAIAAGADAIGIDSFSDEWDGIGGYVDWRNEINDSYSKITKPVHKELMQVIELCPVHLVLTMRAEPKAVFETKSDGSNGKIVRMAEQIVGAKDVGYKVLLEVMMQDAEKMTVINSRYDHELPVGLTFDVKTDEFLKVLQGALNTGNPLPITKNVFVIELGRMGIVGSAAMIALKKDLPKMGEWSPERHEEMLTMVREHLGKGA